MTKQHEPSRSGEADDLHRLILENALDYAILTIDPEGRIQSWSRGAEEVFGWTAEEAIGQMIHLTFTPEDRAAKEPEREMKTAAANGTAPDIKWHLRKDGARVFIDGVTRAVYREGGEVSAFLKIGQDVTQRRRMEDALRESEERYRLLNESLEQRVADRTGDLKRANETARQEAEQRILAESARADVLRQLVQTEENERSRISRELHDSLGQLVTGLRLGLEALEREIGTDGRIGDLKQLADHVARELQHMAVELRPPALDNLGLSPALRDLLGEWSDRYGIESDYHSRGMEEGRLLPEIETTFYRVIQEGLTNAAKHAEASHVSLLLERRGQIVRVILEDNGQGFDVEETLGSPAKARRLGIRGMRERVRLLGGEMEIESSPGSGTTLFVRMPVADG